MGNGRSRRRTNMLGDVALDTENNQGVFLNIIVLHLLNMFHCKIIKRSRASKSESGIVVMCSNSGIASDLSPSPSHESDSCTS